MKKSERLENYYENICSQLTFACSKSTIETLEKDQNKKKKQNDVNDFLLVSLLLTLNIFHTFF